MEKISFREIPLGEITPSPFNPRRVFSGDKLVDLAESISQKGVIEPIIVRPIKAGKKPYEIVAGGRRFHASALANLKTIPAIVRDLTDDEAYDFMLIENLQREDLTALEEAESFKAYISRHGKGKDAINDLAQKTSIDARYIRARIEALTLPKDALTAWEKGEVSFGHLEQLLRLPGPTEVVKKLAEVKRDRMSVAQLRHEIGEWALPLSKARFDVGKECARCRQNSVVQQDLFGIGDAKGMCLNPKCFKAKQAEWLNAHWTETPEAKKHRTKGARFDADVLWQSKKVFYGQKGIAAKCLECDNFVSLVRTDGTVDNAYSDGTACVGDKQCFTAAEQSARAAERTTTRGERAKAIESGLRGRVSWHGAYFRNQFFRKRIPEILSALKPDDERTKTFALICLAHESGEAHEALRKYLGLREGGYQAYGATFKKLLDRPYKEIAPAFAKMVEAVLLQGTDFNEYCGFGTEERRLAAEFLGIDLAKEWAASEEYLQKKTKAEIIAFGKKFRIFSDLNVAAHVARTIGKTPGNVVVADFNSLKKTELINVVLKSGVDLVGKVPTEILK